MALNKKVTSKFLNFLRDAKKKVPKYTIPYTERRDIEIVR